MSALIAWVSGRISAHFGISRSSSVTGNSRRTVPRISSMSSFFNCSQFAARTGTPYWFSILSASAFVSAAYGLVELSTIKNGFPISFSSEIVCSSASRKSSLVSSPKLPSQATTIPMVEWSRITFLVPISAAWVKGIS